MSPTDQALINDDGDWLEISGVYFPVLAVVIIVGLILCLVWVAESGL